MQRLLGIASFRKLCALVLTLGAVVVFAGCSGKTTEATNITHNSATLHATGRCGAGETCTWYWEYWPTSGPRYYGNYQVSKTTPVEGPVHGASPDVPLSAVITGLQPNTTYRWVFCGSRNNGTTYVCVGPHGVGGSTTADPPPDSATFTTVPFEGLAERWTGTSWSIQPTPNPTGARGDSDLSGISCTSDNACTAVGSYTNSAGRRVTLAERWNGTSWTVQPTPNPTGADSSSLKGVSCTSATACTAVGSYTSYVGTIGTIVTLAMGWNGTSWAIQPTPTPTGAGGRSLEGVSCTSATACTAVGGYRIGNDPYAPGPGVTLAERWNGTSWAIQPDPNPTGPKEGFLLGVSCTSATTCTAVGAGDQNLALAERWNGTSWAIQPTPNPTDALSAPLEGVSCTSATACTAVGRSVVGHSTGSQNLTLAERWNGTSWAIQATPNSTGTHTFDNYLKGVSCTSATACTAVGYSDDGYTAPSVTLAMGWNGTSWTVQPTPDSTGGQSASRRLEGVSCTTAPTCTAVGHN